MDIFSASVNAPEFPEKYSDGEALKWLNSSPLSMDKLKGKVVLIDFWTYSCINCQRTLPFIKKWWDKYKDSGLVIIGVHSPEFEFEKDINNIKAALKKYGVDWPVVSDKDMQIWQSYANHYWPAKYLVSHEGKIIYNHFGEGNYVETEIKIQSALRDGGFEVGDNLVSSEGSSLDSFQKQTPELYFGSLRGHIEQTSSDRDLPEEDQIYTYGKWSQEKEFLQHSRETEDLDDLIMLRYRAKDVFLVMETQDGEPASRGEPIKVYVTLDSVRLTPENAGRDVKFDKEGRSFIEVQFSTLYNLVSTDSFGDHTLRISTTSDKLRLFAFTFGG